MPRGREAFFRQKGSDARNEPPHADSNAGAVTDRSAGLMWQQDPGRRMTHDEALAAPEQSPLAGHDDWRLPDVKEVHSIVDGTGSPAARAAAATDPSSPPPPSPTTEATDPTLPLVEHQARLPGGRDRAAGDSALLEVHDAGSPRSDPKAGDASEYPQRRRSPHRQACPLRLRVRRQTRPRDSPWVRPDARGTPPELLTSATGSFEQAGSMLPGRHEKG